MNATEARVATVSARKPARRVGSAALLLAAAAVLAASACGTTAGTAVTAAAVPTSTVTVTETEVEPMDTPTVTTTVTNHADGMATTTAAPVTVTVTAPGPGEGTDATPPEGFIDRGDGVWFHWADHASFECPDGATVCWGMQLWSAQGCPDGIKVYLDLYEADSQKVLTALSWKTNTPLPGGSPTLFVPNSSQSIDGTIQASVTELTCA